MSAFERLPKHYRALCDELSKHMGKMVGFRHEKLSPQNRRVRFTADALLASRNGPYANTVTRQQRRWRERRRLPAPS